MASVSTVNINNENAIVDENAMMAMKQANGERQPKKGLQSAAGNKNNAKPARQPLGVIDVECKAKQVAKRQPLAAVSNVDKKVEPKPIGKAVLVEEKKCTFEIYCDEEIDMVVPETKKLMKDEPTKDVPMDENKENEVKPQPNESVIKLNTLSIEEHKKGTQDTKITDTDEQIKNIMSLIAEENEKLASQEQTASRCFDELILEKCKEYSHEIYIYLIQCEAKFRPDAEYMPKQQDINSKMRSILVDWMVEVADEYRLTDETLFLAVSFVDRFLSVMSISRQSFQLLGTSALFISSKYEEIYPPDVYEFVSITDDTYTKHQVLNMEKLILKVLQFDISSPTAHYFLRKYLSNLQLPKHVNHMAEYLCYLTLLEDYPFLRFLPSEIAICSIILAVHTYDIRGVDLSFYKNTLLAVESNEPANLERIIASKQTCLDAMHKMQMFARQHSQQAIFVKFSSDKFGGVASKTANDKSPDFKCYFT